MFQLLRRQGMSVLGIHAHPLAQDEPHVIVGDGQAAATLLAAGVEHAHTLILAGDDDGVNLTILMQARMLNPQIRIINRLFNTSLGERLDQTLPEHITMSVAALAAPVFTFAALGNAAIGQLQLFHQTWPIHEEYIQPTHPWRGRQLSELWSDRDRMLIYYLPQTGQIDLVTAVLQGQTLQVGDRLIVGTRPRVHQVHPSLSQQLGKLRTGLSYVQQHSRPLLGGTLLLFSTIWITCLVYTSWRLPTSLIDAFYFSIGVLTGTGGSEIGVEMQTAPAELKIFTALVMLAGTAIIGLSYALMNDFILGTRLNHIWEAIRVPERHHFIVCGLGGVGMQIVNHLHTCGHAVLVIEQDPNCRFLNTVRGLKIPVIQGDARLPATLNAANLQQAEALLAVTSNDTANLEMALNAKGLSSNVAAIVRYQDPTFAPMAQQVFGFEAVLSPAELVAPAFAAAALGGRVLGNGMTADYLWVALSMQITLEHPFCGQLVQETAMGADYVPLYLETQGQTIHGWELLETRLRVGDQLYVTMQATPLEALWRSVPLRSPATSAI